MQPPKFARHIPLARRKTLILLFVELRMIRLALLVLAAVCVVYAGNSSVKDRMRHSAGANRQREGAGDGYGDARKGR